MYLSKIHQGSLWKQTWNSCYNTTQHRFTHGDGSGVLAARRIQRAIVRPVSPRVAQGLSMTSTSELVSYDKARKQHEQYTNVLETILGEDRIIHLPLLPNHPDSCFVEDTVVVIGDTAVLMRLGHASRQGEVDSILDSLPSSIVNVIDMRQQDAAALCDGGDILWTGRHVFVGLSERTNQAGLDVLRDAFPHLSVVGVPVSRGNLHLKSIVTHIDDETLVAPTGPVGDQLLTIMGATEYGYTNILRVPDPLASNVVRINEHLLAQAVECQISRRDLTRAAEQRDFEVHFVDTSELAKIDAALTCCSVLLTV